MHYDIYLHRVCRAQPDLGDLLEVIPRLKDHDIQKKLTPYPPVPVDSRIPQRHPPRPGFLELDVEEAQARELYRRLAAVSAVGEVLPASYRNPKISEEQAREIAEQEAVRMQQQDYPTEQFEPVYLRQEEPRWRIFVALFKESQSQEVTFGTRGPWIYVDKVDGHIWRNEDIRALKR